MVRGGQEHQAQQNGDEQTEAEGSHRNVAVGEEVHVGSAQTRRSWRRAREKVPCSIGCVTARGGRLLGDGGLQDTSRLERWRWQAARRRRVHNDLRLRFMLRLNILSPPQPSSQSSERWHRDTLPCPSPQQRSGRGGRSPLSRLAAQPIHPNQVNPPSTRVLDRRCWALRAPSAAPSKPALDRLLGLTRG